MQNTLQIKSTKSDVFVREDAKTDKKYSLHIPISGQLNGFFDISMSENVVISVVEAMTVGVAETSGVDEMAISCIAEFGGMIKGEIINKMKEVNIELSIDEVGLVKAEKLDEVKEKVLVVVADSKFGNFELNLLLK
jgi:CheY-specific phosphatase CheX